MSLLFPAALAAAALAVPLLVLYMLRSRRRRTVVPSVLLWSRAGESVSSAVPWQRLRPTRLLVLQLLALALFTLALARPFSVRETLLGPHTVLVVDTSGSMAMAGRFEQAAARAAELAREASGDQLVSVIEAGPRPRVLAALSQDPAALSTAVASLRVTGGEADLEGAIRLARGLATPDRPTRVLLLSDGGPGGSVTGALSGVRHLLFDAWEENVAITALGAELGSDGIADVFVEVANFGDRPRNVSLELEAGGLPVGGIELEVPASGRARRAVPVEAGRGEVVSARLSGHADALPLDDRSELLIGPGPERTVALVGEGSVFLDALIRSIPGLRPVEGQEADLVVVDRGAAPDGPPRPAWLIRPASPPEGVTVSGVARDLVATYQRPGDPLLEDVDLSELAVAETQVVEAPGWLPLVAAGEVPLVLLGEVDGARTVYFTFDLTHSTLPVRVAFPILGTKLLEWLSGGPPEASASPAGVPLVLSPPPGSRAEVVGPDGVARVAAPGTTVLDADLPGVYRVTYLLPDGTESPGPTAVRQFAAEESAGEWRRLEADVQRSDAGPRGTTVREWAPLLAAALLVLMLAEWWLGHGPSPRTRRSRSAPEPSGPAW